MLKMDDRTNPRIENLINELEILSRYAVKIGLDQGSMNLPKDNNPEISLGEVAIGIEFGTSRQPERSFIRAAIDINKSSIERMIMITIDQVYNGRMSAKECLNRIGEYVLKVIKSHIANMKSPSLSKVTIENRRRRGNYSLLLLQDTKQLINNLKYWVEVR